MFFVIECVIQVLMMFCCVVFLMIRRPPKSTLDRSSAASDVYKRQILYLFFHCGVSKLDIAPVLTISELNKKVVSLLLFIGFGIKIPV